MKNSKFLSIVLSVVLSVLGVALLTQAATTISTSITTAGNITTSAGNLEVTTGTLTVGGNSTLTGTLGVTGKTTLVYATTTAVSLSGSLMVGGHATTTAAGAISTNGSLTVGTSGTALTGMVAGYCTIHDTLTVASTTTYMNCVSATGVVASDKIMVMATGSLPRNFVIKAASSSTDAIINIALVNMGFNDTVQTGENSFNFWAVR